jgi:hypothetical protein
MGDDPAALIHEPLGLPGSGRVRYGAAMALFRAGRLGPDVLEVYREAAAFDARDPALILAERGLPAPPAPSPTDALQRLFLQAREYVNGCSHAGADEVVTGLARVTDAITPPAPMSHPVVERWLQPALAAMSATHLPLADVIARAAPHLVWKSPDGCPRAEIGEGSVTSHAAALIVGEDAPFDARDFSMGLFLIAPHVLCRDQTHAAPELHAPLTGPHGWRFGPGTPLQVLPAHQPVWNPPFQPHLTKVGLVPFLCLYVRTRDIWELARVLPADDWAALEEMRLG